MRHIYHDPFGRWERVRRHSYNSGHMAGGCDWCGTVKRTPTGEKFLFQYGTWADDKARPEWDTRHGFCSIGCFRVYHDIHPEV